MFKGVIAGFRKGFGTPLWLAMTLVLGGPPTVSASEPGAEAVLSLATDLMEVAGLPGISIAILEDGDIAFAEGLGVADLESGRPVTPKTVFRAASVSKTMAVTLLARLVQKGVIGLDDELADIGVDFPNAEGITPRLLSGHLAGIGHYQGSDKIDRRRFYHLRRRCWRVFSEGQRAGEPGGQYQYSTHGYTLLQVAMSTAAQTPFLELLDKELFGPLVMTSSGGDVRAEQHPEMSTLYRMVGRKPSRFPYPE